MQNTTRNTVISAISILVVAIVISLFMQSRDRNTQSTGLDNVPANNNYTQEGQGTDETPVEPTSSEPTPAPAPARLSYTDALKIYGPPPGNNYRYQFSTSCLATPQNLSIKRGTKFMIDNRDTVAHTIAIGTQSFRLSRYGFAIVTAKDVGSYPVRCDGVTRSQISVSQ